MSRLIDQPGTDGVAEHIAQHRQEVTVGLNEKTFETPLPHMTMSPVMLMVAADVTGQPPLHEVAQRGLCPGLHDEMKMIGHETERKHVDGELRFCHGEQLEEGRVVAVFAKDCRAAIAPVEDMVGVAADLTTRNPRHWRRSIGEGRGRRQEKSSLSPYFLAVMLVFGVASVQAETPSAGPLAEINGEAVTAEDLDQALGVKLTKLQEQIYSLKREQLDAMIAERLIAQEASKRGLSVPALLDEEVTSKVGLVTETEIERVFQANKANIKGDESEVRERIRASLQQRKLSAQREQYVRSLREKSTVVDRLEPPPVVRVAVATDGAPVRGDEHAPVTLVEFSDFHCPFCKRVQPTLAILLDRYPGKVKLVYRDMPLQQLHPQAPRAAEAARCAQDQGKFWEYHDVLFQQAPKASDEALNQYATDVGLDSEQFASCLSQNTHREAVQRDINEATKLGLNGTPAFFINGRPISGAQPLEKFVQIIDEELDPKRGQATF